MALVVVAYGWRYSGNDTAYIGAQRAVSADQMHTSRTGIPKGAALWWDGRRTGNSAGHVATYGGNGHIFSNDVNGHGTVGRVAWNYPEETTPNSACRANARRRWEPTSKLASQNLAPNLADKALQPAQPPEPPYRLRRAFTLRVGGSSTTLSVVGNPQRRPRAILSTSGAPRAG